ncbi:uncharacterized protein AKAW2_70867S [Aspergillus luchuensis]|uniref:Uncharacterized protein n=1 Tax=Aspergillus kawachii TaxID=1069201 RepID=A0A7R7WK54_ASPKA|nr:uncharacterized protein AKAW2_70867S [Aspergillus luchuensis]BCS03989.1 hypothetical protein AKAW2_70867S [Aspergillus luchuensis]
MDPPLNLTIPWLVSIPSVIILHYSPNAQISEMLGQSALKLTTHGWIHQHKSAGRWRLLHPSRHTKPFNIIGRLKPLFSHGFGSSRIPSPSYAFKSVHPCAPRPFHQPYA